MNRIIDRSQALDAIGDNKPGEAQLKSDIARLKRRAALLNISIFFSIISGIITSILVMAAFVTAYLNVRHEYGVAILFVLSLGFFTAFASEFWFAKQSSHYTSTITSAAPD